MAVAFQEYAGCPRFGGATAHVARNGPGVNLWLIAAS